MHVVVGPVSTSSVRAYAAYATDVLAEVDAEIPDDVHVAFRSYVGEWTRLAGSDRTDVVWETDAPAEVVEYLVLAFYRLTERRRTMGGVEVTTGPPEGEEFYRSLVQGLLTAMADAGGGAAEFADQLRSFWPGVGED